jgi:hypothetical protein
MNCDLCKHRGLDLENGFLCETCAEMIQRLLIAQQRIDSCESRKTAAAAEQRAANSLRWAQWQ